MGLCRRWILRSDCKEHGARSLIHTDLLNLERKTQAAKLVRVRSHRMYIFVTDPQ